MLTLDEQKLRDLKKSNFPLKTAAALLTELKYPIVPLDQFKDIFPHSVEIAGELYLPPTLEDMFQALGDEFRLLERHEVWSALGGQELTKQMRVDGKTPSMPLQIYF